MITVALYRPFPKYRAAFEAEALIALVVARNVTDAPSALHAAKQIRRLGDELERTGPPPVPIDLGQSDHSSGTDRFGA